MRQFSSPGGIPSHVSVQTPGSIHEGGELGYALVHAAGAAFDHPDLLVTCVVGDGEAETGPLAASWKIPSFLNARRDGAVLPILQLNGYKIAGPTVLGRTTDDDVTAYLSGHGWDAVVVEGNEPEAVLQELYAAVAGAHERIREIQSEARSGTGPVRSAPAGRRSFCAPPRAGRVPMSVDGVQVEGTFRAHQVPLSGVRENPAHLELLEAWMRSYDPD